MDNQNEAPGAATVEWDVVLYLSNDDSKGRYYKYPPSTLLTDIFQTYADEVGVPQDSLSLETAHDAQSLADYGEVAEGTRFVRLKVVAVPVPRSRAQLKPQILVKRSKRFAIIAAALASVDVILVIISTSLSAKGVISVNSGIAKALDSIGICLSLCLMVSVIIFHINDVRFTRKFTWDRILMAVGETLICWLRPLPFSNFSSRAEMRLDSFLAFLALMRLFTVARAIRFQGPHHALFARRKLSGLFLAFSLIVLINSWAFYLQERQFNEGMQTYVDSLWFVTATVTHVGYGDIVARTPPGKIVATITALMGWMLAGALIGVVSQKVAAFAKSHCEE